jgi:cytosine permease
MSKQEIVEDFTLQPVPNEQTLSGLKIGIVILALGFTLPLLSLGSQIAKAQGIERAGTIFFAGCFLVALVSLATSLIGARQRVSTYVILEHTFGTIGGRLCNALLGLSLLGWFSNVADLLGTAVSETLHTIWGVEVSAFVCTTCGIALMTTTAIFGFRLMERFASIMVPILSAFMLYIVHKSLQIGSIGQAFALQGDQSIGFVDGISAVVGLVILTAVLAPDFTRYARNGRAAILSVAGLAFGYPLIMLIAAIPATIFGQADIMKVMADLQMPGVALLLFILSTWTSNTGNLYSMTLTTATILPRTPVWQLGVGGALAAVVAAYFHISTYFVSFLVLLGIGTIPVAGIYVCEAFLGKRNGGADTPAPSIRPANLAAFMIAAGTGYLSAFRGGIIVPIPALEGLLCAVAAWLLLNRPWRAGGAPWLRDNPSASR